MSLLYLSYKFYKNLGICNFLLIIYINELTDLQLEKKKDCKNSPFDLEPMVGIEPTTYSLRVNCSTPEPHWLDVP